MRADTFNLTRIFGQDARYVVPLFQRPYVWNQEKNWEPLWEDVQRAAHEVEDGVVGHPHFLGAIVLLAVAPEFGQLATWEVIDGQQRLTTLQVLLASSRAAVEFVGDERSARLLGRFIDNDADLVPIGHERAQYKVWPTNADQQQFLDAMTVANGTGQLVKARHWFQQEIIIWLREAPDLEQRIAALVLALREKLRLVVIDLERDDDAQVIFETLNGRGTPLEAADLVKNLLFRLAKQRGCDVNRLYTERWQPFDQGYWREQVSVGRQFRSRLDVFLTHWLSMRTLREVTASTLYAGMSDWIETSQSDPEDVFDELCRYAEIYDSFERNLPNSFERRFFDRLNTHQTTTVIPLLLHIWGLGNAINPAQRVRVLRALDSFLMRRAVCGGSTKDYNNLFREVLVEAAGADPAEVDSVIIKKLAGAGAASRLWPNDIEFQRAIVHGQLYRTMVRARLRSLLEGIEHELRSTGFTEQLAGDGGLTVEHVMPQRWQTNWPLAGDRLADSRDEAVQTLGNLTLVTQRLNPTMSNSAWREKRAWLSTHSLLRLTTSSILHPPPGQQADGNWAELWDEGRIRIRAEFLGDVAVRIWPSPDNLIGRPLTRQAVEAIPTPMAPAAPLRMAIPRHEHAADQPGDGLRRRYIETIADLVARGAITPGAVLYGRYGGYNAMVNANGEIVVDGRSFSNPSAAARAAGIETSVNGWEFWMIGTGENRVSIGSLRTCVFRVIVTGDFGKA